MSAFAFAAQYKFYDVFNVSYISRKYTARSYC